AIAACRTQPEERPRPLLRLLSLTNTHSHPLPAMLLASLGFPFRYCIALDPPFLCCFAPSTHFIRSVLASFHPILHRDSGLCRHMYVPSASKSVTVHDQCDSVLVSTKHERVMRAAEGHHEAGTTKLNK